MLSSLVRPMMTIMLGVMTVLLLGVLLLGVLLLGVLLLGVLLLSLRFEVIILFM
jgi:hypothetical protein